MRGLFVLSLVGFLIAPAVFAQDSGEQPGADCSRFVASTLTEAARVCADSESNRACFAHGPLEVTRYSGQKMTIGTPGYTVALDSLYALRSGALDPETGDWGISTLRVPMDSDGNDVFLVLAGDVEMRNSCSALVQQAVHLTRETELHTGPGSHYESLGLLPVGTELQVNACNCTGNWLRAVTPDQQVGWIWVGSAEGLRDPAALPIVGQNTPVYNPMQAFCLRTGSAAACSGAVEDGLLLQSPHAIGEARLQINQIEIGLIGTAFVQAQPEHQFSLEVIDGAASITLDGFTLAVPRGFRAVVPLNADNRPEGPATIELFGVADVAAAPVALLPEAVDPAAARPDPIPAIVGVEACQVAPDQAPTACRVHFVNADADAIRTLDVEFVRAPEGEWNGSSHDNPLLLDGDSTGGVLAWEATCSVGSTIFVGPVVWQLTLTDAQGHRSLPFVASFNCG